MAQFHAFYDTETTGPVPRFDQILQAAAILTDDDFVEIESFDERCRLSSRIIPTAGALKVTDVDPADLARAPHDPHGFARMLHDRFSGWGARGDLAYTGYNILNFDEEILRQTFWENLLDPYLSSGRGRSRNDLLRVARAMYARNPDCLEVARNPETGKPNFKLETLAPLNGFDGHDAHDALGDVRATIFVARMIRDTDPALWHHLSDMGNANAARDFIEAERMVRMVNASATNPGALDVMLVASQPDNAKAKMVFDLSKDPLPYLDLGPEELLAVMNGKESPLRSVKCNKQPTIFPMGWEFLNRAADIPDTDTATMEARAEMIAAHDDFRANTAQAMKMRVDSYDAPTCLEEKIYAGFPSDATKRLMRDFHAQPDWARKLDIVRSIDHDTTRALGLRLVYDNAPDTLTPPMREACAARLADERFTLATGKPWTTVGDLMAELDKMQAAAPDDPHLAAIRAWAIATYPVAAAWTGGEPVVEDPAAHADASGVTDIPEDASEITTAGSSTPANAAPAPHFLDGLA